MCDLYRICCYLMKVINCSFKTREAGLRMGFWLGFGENGR